eukprot:CAMPEP_0182433546 /NCGR_PEP_ID=MMETSP1167-20130531/63940_1 /TAXON_ID=2988 /ORGANISM="Mallomonas Sp, Strain CCMP3275" /LENGTH=558 /DNA_ID=CAMNT_0024622379 /DNA_START=14 /DNA_END=1687 /DNA_ORIENTATION=+
MQAEEGSLVETAEEKAARRALKKTKKEKKHGDSRNGSVNVSQGNMNITKEDHSMNGSDDKKRKRSEDDLKAADITTTANKKKRSESVDDSMEPIIPRRRTRSISEHEEVYIPRQSPEDFRKEHQITINGAGDDGSGTYTCPPPMSSFDCTPFEAPIRRAFERAGFTAPTLTQAQAWPIALSGRDVITVAKTGSGKTCGFLLPAFHRLMAQNKVNRGGSPAILVLAPTRELACQIEEESIRFGRTSNIRSACAYGGAPKSLQINKIRAGVDVIIATPGRLSDLIEMRVVSLKYVTFLVLDEADRMLDMGFEPQIRSIISNLPSVTERQSMMFTATWPREVEKLAREFLNNPVEIRFGSSTKLNANKAIKQIIKVVDERDKGDKLKEVLQEMNPTKAVEQVPKSIIFVSRKYACDKLADELWNMGYSVDSLHGDKQQFMRTKVMGQFKRSEIRLLVATDVAARGLDVKDIEMVINYDFPSGQNGVEDYVHRIGRTGRAGAQGVAVTFFTSQDEKRAHELIGVLTRAEQEVPEDLKRFDSGGRGRGGGGFHMGRGGGGRGR